jgi:hypothetical protein
MISRRQTLLGGGALASGALSSCAVPAWRTEQYTKEIKESLQPSPADSQITLGFERLQEKFPWLTDVRKSVGLSWIFTKETAEHQPKSIPFGSSVVIDDDGSQIMSYHQTRFARLLLNNPDKRLKDIATLTTIPSDKTTTAILTGNLLWGSELHDLSLGISAQKQDGIAAARIYSNNIKELFSKSVIMCGYASDRRYFDDSDYFQANHSVPLHASIGTIADYSFNISTKGNGTIHKIKCAVQSNALTLPNMSGGGAFVDGELIGILSSGVGPLDFTLLNLQTHFVPISYGIQMYNYLFPKKALPLGVNLAKVPEECKFNPDDAGSM